jgi:hypothetical protein
MPITPLTSQRQSQALPPAAADLRAPEAQVTRSRSASQAAPAFVAPSQTPPKMPGLLVDASSQERLSIDDVINTPSQTRHDNIESFRKVNNRQGVDLADMSKRQDAAKSVGVNVAKQNFYAKLGGAVVVGLIALGMVTATIVTGGMVPVVAASIASVAAMRMGANAWCAKQMLRNAQAAQQGHPPPHNLPMGSDGLANLLYKAGFNSWSHQTRQKIAGWGSTAASSALLAGSLAVTAGAAALPLAIVGLSLLAAARIQQNRLDRLPTADEVLNQDIALPGEAAPTLVQERLLEKIFTLHDLQQDLDSLKNSDGNQAPADEITALAQDIQTQELKLAEQLDRLAEQLEKPIIKANREVGAGLGMVQGAAQTLAEFGFDKVVDAAGEALGTHDFAIIGGVVNLAIVSVQLRSRQAELTQLQDLQRLDNPDIAALQQRHMELTNKEDDAAFEMHIEATPPGFQPAFV